MHLDALERPLGPDRDGLVAAVRAVERVDAERLGVAVDDRLRIVRIVSGLGDRERERDVLRELGLHERLVVREDEVVDALVGLPLVVRVGGRRRRAGRHLGREAERAVQLLHVRVGVAVGGVELGREVRVVARDGGSASSPAIAS